VRTAAEIRQGRAWVEVHGTAPDEGWYLCIWTREGDNITARYGLKSESFNRRADVPEMGVANARVLDIPAIYGDAVLYDPPDRLAALQKAGDALAGAAEPSVEYYLYCSFVDCKQENLGKWDAALAAWLEASRP